MPELPEVETVRRGLSEQFDQAQIKQVLLHRRNLRFDIPSDLPERLEGQRVLSYERRAKYLLWHFEQGLTMLMHLGMSGRVVIYSAQQSAAHQIPVRDKHDHLEFFCHSGRLVRYNDPRRFGFVSLVPSDQLAQSPFLHSLGPEPLSADFSPSFCIASALGRKQAIKTLIMDQRFVVGVGNIYASEALFAARIHPFMPAKDLSAAQWQDLVAAIKMVLQVAIQAGGSSLRDYRQTDGSLGYFQHQWQVYGRADQACPRCEARLTKSVQAQRASYFCAQCQSLPA